MINEIEHTARILLDGGVILYPTDTVWGIGCDATQKDAVEKIYRIKQRSESKSMILLVDSTERLGNYVENLPELAITLINEAKKPLTIIYPKAKNLPWNVVAVDGSVAIRVVNHEFCKQLIRQINAPLVSTSANISGNPAPAKFEEISMEIKQQMDSIVDLRFDLSGNPQPSTLIKLIDQTHFEVIRP
jgi:L-threonylcarbamoyladenylate synthase